MFNSYLVTQHGSISGLHRLENQQLYLHPNLQLYSPLSLTVSGRAVIVRQVTHYATLTERPVSRDSELIR